MWSRLVLAKYWAMQLPATMIIIVALLSAEQGLGWSQWIIWAIVAAWVGKDAVLYPLVWRSYDPDYLMSMPYRMEGSKGMAVNHISPSGFVRIWGELWRAELSRDARQIKEGETVLVRARNGLTLLVEPEEPSSAPKI